MKYFIDTSAFIALEDRSDQFHVKSKEFYLSLTPTDHLYTTNYVLDETITRLRYANSHAASVRFAETVFKSNILTIIYIDSDLEKQAIQIFKKFSDKKLSFTDCTSMAVLRQHRLDACFAFDDDFKITGFRVVP